jgi:tetratricopeptide (TPR) repeat protein
MEYAVSQPMPEPWILLTLLRTYISEIAVKGREYYGSKAIKLAHQLFDILEYKKFIYNILGWLYTYCHSIRNLETAFHYFDQTLELDPRDQTALLHRARISEMMGNLDFAKRSYEEIIILNTTHREASRKLAQYQEEELI